MLGITSRQSPCITLLIYLIFLFNDYITFLLLKLEAGVRIGLTLIGLWDRPILQHCLPQYYNGHGDWNRTNITRFKDLHPTNRLPRNFGVTWGTRILFSSFTTRGFTYKLTPRWSQQPRIELASRVYNTLILPLNYAGIWWRQWESRPRIKVFVLR